MYFYKATFLVYSQHRISYDNTFNAPLSSIKKNPIISFLKITGLFISNYLIAVDFLIFIILVSYVK